MKNIYFVFLGFLLVAYLFALSAVSAEKNETDDKIAEKEQKIQEKIDSLQEKIQKLEQFRERIKNNSVIKV